MRRSPRVLLVLLLLLAAGSLGRPASAMPDQAVRAPAPVGGSGGLVTGAALVRTIPLAPAESPAKGVWPLDPAPEVVRGFDPPQTSYAAGHRGVDLRGRVGQRVRAALAGEVTFAGRLAGRGVVVVSHGATRTTYEPVEATVRRGDKVTTGQPIGTLEWSGSHCLPTGCLHWGLRRGDTYLDPLDLVGGGPRPVRLYPW
jgi:murein DD-endopeptidase MepM/ murein hydrolase activator NlpD